VCGCFCVDVCVCVCVFVCVWRTVQPELLPVPILPTFALKPNQTKPVKQFHLPATESRFICAQHISESSQQNKITSKLSYTNVNQFVLFAPHVEYKSHSIFPLQIGM